MSQSFIDLLQQHGFQLEQAKLLYQEAEYLGVPTGTILSYQGDKVEHIYFLIEGLCHACYLTVEGKKFTKEFYWARDCIINFESVIQKEPSTYLVETLAPSQFVRLPLTQIQQLREQRHPFYLWLVENQLLHKENKERFMLLHSPEARYKLFIERFSDLERRLSDYQVASYIGVTPISLSRIKKRLAS